MNSKPLANHPTIVRFLEQRFSGNPRIPIAALKDVPRTLRDIATEVAAVSSGWNAVELYTPSNTATEKTRFFEHWAEGGMYNPQFVYEGAADIRTADARACLIRLDSEAARLMPDINKNAAAVWYLQALRGKIADDLATCDMIEGLSGSKEEWNSTKHAFNRKYSGLDNLLLQLAQHDYTQRLAPSEHTETTGSLTRAQVEYLTQRTYTAEQMRTVFERMLCEYGLLQTTPGGQGFALVISSEVQAIDVRHRSKNGPTVFIPEKRRDPMNAITLLLLCRHEIEAHARQSENGRALLGIWGGDLALDDETFYEGLAMRYEELYKQKLGAKERRPYPYTYITAVAQAQKGGSFANIFEDQLERHIRTELHIAEKSIVPRKEEVDKTVWSDAEHWAWRTTLRVMRGLRDTANPDWFCMPKDLAYMQGLYLQRELDAQELGHFNEVGIIPSNEGLISLAQFEITPDDIPFKDLHLTDKLLDQLLAEMCP